MDTDCTASPRLRQGARRSGPHGREAGAGSADPALRTLGIEATFSAIPVPARPIEQRSTFGDQGDLIPVADGRIHVSEVVLPAAIPVAGMALWGCRLPEGAVIGAVVHGDATIVPSGSTVLTAADRLVITALPEGRDGLLRMFGGR